VPPAVLTRCLIGEKSSFYIIIRLSTEVEDMVSHISERLKGSSLEGRLQYLARHKEPGKDHHAKAGNLNHAILEAGTRGRFIVVFDSDVSVNTFLEELVLHTECEWLGDAYKVQITPFSRPAQKDASSSCSTRT
jgi:hypothetical protein